MHGTRDRSVNVHRYKALSNIFTTAFVATVCFLTWTLKSDTGYNNLGSIELKIVALK